jgi:hypothetical protein
VADAFIDGNLDVLAEIVMFKIPRSRMSLFAFVNIFIIYCRTLAIFSALSINERSDEIGGCLSSAPY